MSCRYIAFDVDGTLLNALPAALQSFQQTLWEFTGHTYSIEELYPTMGRSNEDALALLGLTYSEALIRRWIELQSAMGGDVHLFPNVPEVLAELKRRRCVLGIVTSRSHEEYEMDRRLFDRIECFFDHIILYEMTQEHKPSPQPLQKFMELSGAVPSETLYVGDTLWDMQCAGAAGAKGGLALWGALDQSVPADYRFSMPEFILEVV